MDTVLNYVAEKKPHERTRQAKSKFKTKILLQHVWHVLLQRPWLWRA